METTAQCDMSEAQNEWVDSVDVGPIYGREPRLGCTRLSDVILDARRLDARARALGWWWVRQIGDVAVSPAFVAAWVCHAVTRRGDGNSEELPSAQMADAADAWRRTLSPDEYRGRVAACLLADLGMVTQVYTSSLAAIEEAVGIGIHEDPLWALCIGIAVDAGAAEICAAVEDVFSGEGSVWGVMGDLVDGRRPPEHSAA